MRNLGESKYFGDVDLDGTKLTKQKRGLNIVQFDLKATLLGPKGTAPVAEGAKPAGPKGAKPAAKRG